MSFENDYVGKSLPNFMPKLKSLLFQRSKPYQTKYVLHIKKNIYNNAGNFFLHFINSANSSTTSKVTLAKVSDTKHFNVTLH